MAKRREIKKVTESINRLGLDDAKGMTEQLNQEPSVQDGDNRGITEDTEQEKLNSKKRVKLTTMINPTLRDRLKLITIKKNCNLSDVLEDAIKQYLDGQ